MTTHYIYIINLALKYLVEKIMIYEELKFNILIDSSIKTNLDIDDIKEINNLRKRLRTLYQ
jgi:hypothetical protein